MVLKYVKHNVLGFILWANTDNLYHSHVGSLTSGEVGGEILSAGFASLHDGEVKCWGKSESLNIRSDKNDAQELAVQLGLEVPLIGESNE